MRMLISGGNGFLGSYLAESAIAKGIEVTVVDDFSTMDKVNVPETVKLIRMPIEEYQAEESFDYVVHLAARPSPEDYIAEPIKTITSNSIGTYKMLEIARRNNAIFLYTSSSEVYGDAEIIPTPESYYGKVNPNGIRSCYDESKRFSEALSMAYFRKYGTDVRIQRPFNVYGPRIRWDSQYGRVIPRFIAQALKNEPITVHGDGSQTRSFLYISDWLDATWKMLENDTAKGHVFNIGNNTEISIMGLALLIKKLTNSNAEIKRIEPRAEDPRRRAADISKAKEVLGWEPRVSLEEGLQHTIAWVKEVLK